MKHALLFPILPGRLVVLSTVLGIVGLAACSNTPAGNPTAKPPAAGQPASAQSGSAPPAASAATFTGTVVETMNSGGYTYMRLQSGQKDVWIAATELPIKQGESLTVPLEMPMENFHSSTLNRDFPLVYFVSEVARAGQSLQASAGAAPAGAGALAPMGSHASATPPAAGPLTVQPNAPPAGGLSMADVWAKREALAGKQVTVRGTVVKVNNGIMDRNWFHLQDGSGNAKDGTNDLTVTSNALVKVGDVVTVTGTLGIDKDFTAGYAYGAILEQATIR
jgi:starvation-inducible outer membrane lipoprotein